MGAGGGGQQRGVGEGLKLGAGLGSPEASPGLASPSLPQLRFAVAHSETGRTGQGAGILPPALGLTHEAGKRERRGQRVEAQLPPDLPPAMSKVTHSWLRSF